MLKGVLCIEFLFFCKLKGLNPDLLKTQPRVEPTDKLSPGYSNEPKAIAHICVSSFFASHLFLLIIGVLGTERQGELFEIKDDHLKLIHVSCVRNIYSEKKNILQWVLSFFDNYKTSGSFKFMIICHVLVDIKASDSYYVT